MAQLQSRNLGDIVLFTELFEIEVILSPEECIQRLRNLEQPRKGWLIGATSRKIVINPIANGAYDFDLRIMRYGRGADYTSVKAVGRIESLNGQTIIQGEIKFGWFYYLGVISIAVVILSILLSDLSRMRSSSAVLIAVGSSAIFAYYVWTLIRDRLTLKQLIYTTLYNTP
jgi:hypothetical protein